VSRRLTLGVIGDILAQKLADGATLIRGFDGDALISDEAIWRSQVKFFDKCFPISRICAILAVWSKGSSVPAPARVSKPARSLTEEHKRAQRIFARLMAGESMRAIATLENLSLRRVQQIVREQLDRRNANPADDFALLQIARLERALDLIGGQMYAGKPSAAHAFVRILDHLSRLAPTACGSRPHSKGSATRSTRGRSARPPRCGARGAGVQAGRNGPEKRCARTHRKPRNG
jgi:hypothetical protein